MESLISFLGSALMFVLIFAITAGVVAFVLISLEKLVMKFKKKSTTEKTPQEHVLR